MTVAEWLNIDIQKVLSKAHWFGATVLIILVVVASIYTIFLLFGFYQLGLAVTGSIPYGEDGTGAAIRNIGLMVAATVSIPFLIWRSIVAQKQANIAEQGHITDTINKAVEGLGAEKTVKRIIELPQFETHEDEYGPIQDGVPVTATRADGTEIIKREAIEETLPNLEVRVGAIYALERIAKDSLRDHLQIMEILCAYIRENAPATSLEPTEPPFDRAVPRTDIQAAITVIGRRSQRQIDLEWESRFRLNLKSTDLSGVDFTGADFSAALLSKCRLEMSIFRNSKLVGTIFDHSLVNFVDMFGAELRGTRFDHGTFSGIIDPGKIYGVSFLGADISEVRFLGNRPITNLTYGSADTDLHPDLDFDRGEVELLQLTIRVEQNNGNTQKVKELEAELYENNSFADWCPHKSDDGAAVFQKRDFLNRLGLTDWPHQESS